MDSAHSLSRADSLCASMHLRPGDGTHQWSRGLFGAQQSWCALTPWRQLQVRAASYFVSGEPWSTVHMEQRAFGGILYLLRSDCRLRWLDVCICADASENRFAFAFREGCRGLASEVGCVQRISRSVPCQVACTTACKGDVVNVEAGFLHYTPAMRRASQCSLRREPVRPKLSAFDQRKPTDPKPCSPPSNGGAEPANEKSRIRTSSEGTGSVTSWQKNIAQEKSIGSVAGTG